MINRINPKASARIALTDIEIKLLENLVKANGSDWKQEQNVCVYITKIAKLGGYLGRASDPPPGNQVIWKGLSRLIDIQVGFEMALSLRDVGN